jgi:branched-subunit amino acid transport protein
MTMWLAILAVGLGSYALRLAPLLLGARVRWSDRWDRALRDASVGAMTALLVSGVQTFSDQVDRLGTIAGVAAVTVAASVAWLGRSMLVVMLIGAATYGLLLVALQAVSG